LKLKTEHYLRTVLCAGNQYLGTVLRRVLYTGNQYLGTVLEESALYRKAVLKQYCFPAQSTILKYLSVLKY
jgi:hypothetical protein